MSNFTSDFWESESEYGEDSTISRESTPLPASISEFEDNRIHSTAQNDDSELEDEATRCKPQQWTDHSESKNAEIRTSLQQSASGVDDEAFSPEPRELYTIYEWDEEFEDDQQDDEPLEANSPEPEQLSPVHQSLPEFDDDQQDDEPLKAEIPEPRRLFSLRHESHVPEYDDGEKDDDSFGSSSPESRRLFPVHEFHPTLYGPQQPAP